MSSVEWSPDKALYIEPVSVTFSENEAAYYLREAWKNIYGEYPQDKSLAILWSQTALETGRFKVQFMNYNYGNIKKRHAGNRVDKLGRVTHRYNDDGRFYTMFGCSEVINGKEIWFDPPAIETHFRAYKTAIEGAEDYIKLVSQRSRYVKAWQALLAGDPVQYVKELRAGGYFTASLDRYTKTVVSLTNEFLRRRDELLAWEERDTDPAPPNFEEAPNLDADPISDTDPSTFEPEELIKTEPWNPSIEFDKDPDIYDPEPEAKEKDPTFGMVAILVAVASALYVYLSMMFPGCF